MNTSKTEFLSAFLDDEAGEFERRRLVNELAKDDELAQTFNRYALMGEAMRTAASGQRAVAGVSLLSHIQAELADEPAYTSAMNEMATAAVTAPAISHARPSWSRGRMAALAATLAAVAVGGMLFIQQPSTSDKAAQVAVAPVAAPAPVQPAVAAATDGVLVASTGSAESRIHQIGRVDPQARDILKQYVAQHVKYASTTVIAPSVRAVSYANEY